MAKERNAGEQHNQEMEFWTNRIKIELTGVSEQFIQLQQFYGKFAETMSSSSKRSSSNDKASHSDQILKNLQKRFTDMSSSYRASLTARSEILKSQRQRREVFGDEPVQDYSKNILPVTSNGMHRSANDLRLRTTHRVFSPNESFSHQTTGASLAETSIDIPMSQMQLQVAAPSTLSAVITSYRNII